MRDQFFKLVFTSLCLCIAFTALAQQTPYLSFYRYNWQVVNPAAMDKSFIFNEHRPFIISGNYRQQWIGLEGAPKFFYASMEHKPVNDQQFSYPIKWGFQGFGDVTDGYETYGGYGNFSYFIPFLNPRGQFLHIGISAGIIQQKTALDEGDFDIPEPDLNANVKWYADFAMGVFYRHKREWYVGISSPQVLSPVLGQTDGKRWLPTERTHHYYLMAGGFIEGYNFEGILEPSLWLRYAPGLGYQTLGNDIPVSADLNLRYHSYARVDQVTYWLGGGVGTSKYAHLEAGINFPFEAIVNSAGDKLGVGFIFSLPFGQNGLNLGNSLELSVSYAWD